MFCASSTEDFGGGFIVEEERSFSVRRENMDVLGKAVKPIAVSMAS